MTTRPTYLAAVLQDASKSYVAFLLLCTIGLCPQLHVYVYDMGIISNYEDTRMIASEDVLLGTGKTRSKSELF